MYYEKFDRATTGFITIVEYDKDYIKGLSQVGGAISSFIPFVTLPEIHQNMKDALKNNDEIKFAAAALMFASVVTLDTIDVATLGKGKVATTPIKKSLKEVLENPAIRKNVYSIIKNNVDELSKYFPKLKQFKKSKVYKQLDNYLDDMFNTLNKGVEKFPKTKNVVLETLEKSKQAIPYKHESNFYSIMNKQLENLPDVVKSNFRSLHGQPISILTIDKSKMWALNALDKSQLIGDTALTLYNTCVLKTKKEVMSKFSSKGLLRFEAVRTGSDEIIVIVTGSNEKLVRDATKLFKEQFESNLNKLSSEAIEPLQKAFSAVEVIPEHGYIYANKNTFGLTKGGKSQKGKIYSLGDFSSRSETRKTFNEYITRFTNGNINHSDVKYLRELAGVNSKAIDLIKEGTVIDGVIGYRLKLNKNTQRIFNNVTTINNKGVSAVNQNLVGPSVFNQLGHKFVDSFNYEYSKTLISTAKKYGLDVKVYQSGPMQLAYKFDNLADPNVVKSVLNESEQIFSKSLKSKGFSELKTFYNNSKTYTNDVSNALNSNINLTSRLERGVNYSDEVISNVNNILSQHSLGFYFHPLLENISKSTRNIDDLAQELITKGYKKEEVFEFIMKINDVY
jgi:predicted DNA-binding protein YlxM (UPF0122 family)